MTAAEKLARRFHDLYEQMAPGFGYTTREETRQFIPESPNGKLMIAVCEAIAASPEVAKLVADAVAAERARCVEIAVRHWEGEPEDTIAMAAEMLVGMTSLTEYERKVTQMRENFPNGI